MALLDALGARLVADGVGVLGTSIFLGYMPPTPDVCVAVYEARGNGPQQTFGPSVVAVERPLIRIIARAARNDYPAARTKAEAVRASLGDIRGETISGVNFQCVSPTSDLFPMRLDDKERALIALDFVAWLNP
jgi:hypothetical protein